MRWNTPTRSFETREPSGTLRLPRRRAVRHASAGFTVIELVVVIAIILIIISLVTAAAVYKQGPLSRTRAILANLQSVEVQCEASPNPHRVVQTLLSKTNPINWASDPQAVNAPGATGTSLLSNPSYTGQMDIQLFSGARFVQQAMQNPDCESMIRSIGKSYLLLDPGNPQFLIPLDGWGNPIIYVASVSHHDSDTTDDFLPESTRPYFVSAGPDSNGMPPTAPLKWGNVDNNGVPDAPASDNLYSYELNK